MTGNDEPGVISGDDVGKALDAVLNSETFSRSERARDLLGYLVRTEQKGEADRLKGFSIAVDVFGRDENFDPSTDALVRVQAGRLRDLLKSYYEGEGAADPVLISIPRGAYVPSYKRSKATGRKLGDLRFRTAAEPSSFLDKDAPVQPVVSRAPPAIGDKTISEPTKAKPSKSPPLDPFVIRNIRRFWVAVSVIIVLLVVVIARLLTAQAPVVDADGVASASQRVVRGVRGAATTAFLPLVSVDEPGRVKPDNELTKIAQRLASGVAGFDSVDVIVPTEDGAAAAISQVPLAFRFEFERNNENPDLANVRLMHPETGAFLFEERIETKADSARLDAFIAGVLSQTVAPDGSIYGYAVSRGIANSLVRCISLTAAFYNDQTTANHRAAYDCNETLITRGAKLAIVFADRASLIMEAITDRYDYPANVTMDDAIKAARNAISIDPTSAYAWRAYGAALAAGNEAKAAVDAMREAYKHNPYDLRLSASFGYALVYSGEYAEGETVLKRAVDGLKSHPTWWDYTLFMAALMTGNRELMASSTGLLIGSPRQHYLAARLVAAHQRGLTSEAQSLIEQLHTERPEFVADPKKVFLDSRYPEPLAAKFEAELRAAGL